MKKVFLGILWGLAIWLVLAFLMGTIVGMTRAPILLRSSDLSNLVLLPPSLLLGIILVVKGQSLFIKRLLILVLLTLALWFVASMLMVALIKLSNAPQVKAIKYVHIVNPLLLIVAFLASGILLFKILPKMQK